MIKLNVTSVMVLDQEEALDFYVNKLGLEKAQDIHQGPFRWLTVRVPVIPRSRSSCRSPARRSRTKPPPPAP
jgi:catechol 2,3-dioxygenase-like lactoylglutathione lyase family enzyme